MYKRTGLQLWANPQMLWEVIVSSRGQELRLQDPQDQFCLACLPYVLSRKEEASQLTHHFKKSSPLVPQDIPWSDAISYLSLSTQPLPLCPQEPTAFTCQLLNTLYLPSDCSHRTGVQGSPACTGTSSPVVPAEAAVFSLTLQ